MINQLLNIGLDLDSTLIEPYIKAHILASYALKEETIPKLKDFNFSNFKPHVRNEIYRLFLDDFFMNRFMRPIEGTNKKLQIWRQQGHTLTIITARDENIQKGSTQMIYRFFPNVIKQIDFVPLGTSKKEKMIDNKLDVWVDDNIDGVETALDLGLKTYIVTHNYNKNLKHKELIRVNNVSEIDINL